MEVYKAECTEIVRRFLKHQISYPHCVAALDAALADVVIRFNPEDLPELRAIVQENNSTVMAERMRSAGPRSLTESLTQNRN